MSTLNELAVEMVAALKRNAIKRIERGEPWWREHVDACDYITAALTEVERLRPEMAKPRDPVTVLPVEIATLMQGWSEAVSHAREMMLRMSKAQSAHAHSVLSDDFEAAANLRDQIGSNLRTAILKFANRNGGA